MEQPLDISEVCRRTGLTSRALRFYEARGLLAPLRTYSGRRLYGPGELERINLIVSLKRAGLTLSQIARLTGRGGLDLKQLVDAQLAVIAERRAELREAEALLLNVKSRIDRGEPVDAATFCSLIKNEDLIMTKGQGRGPLFHSRAAGALGRTDAGRSRRFRSGCLQSAMGRPRQKGRRGHAARPRQRRGAGAL
jgi:DNA-binding transcriptional MerR regulator